MLISSTDKNFMVPVGGSLVYSPNKKSIVDKVNRMYPGRASGSPIVDLFITLLSLGETQFKALLQERKSNYKFLSEELQIWCEKHNEKMLKIPNNKISLAVNISTLFEKSLRPNNLTPSFLGSYLFSRRVSGVRIVQANAQETSVAGIGFKNYGSHCDSYAWLPYFNAAAAVGQTKEEISIFMAKLDEAYSKLLA